MLGRDEQLEAEAARRCSRFLPMRVPTRSGFPPAGSGRASVAMLSSLRNGSGSAPVVDEAGQDLAAGPALQCEHRDLAGLVGQLSHRVKPARWSSKCSPVLDAVAALTTSRYSPSAEAVEIRRIVTAAAGSLWARWLYCRLKQVERRGVVGEHVLQEGQGARDRGA